MKMKLFSVCVFAFIFAGMGMVPKKAEAARKSCSIKLVFKNTQSKAYHIRQLRTQVKGGIWQLIFATHYKKLLKIQPGQTHTFTATVKVKKSFSCSRVRKFKFWGALAGAPSLSTFVSINFDPPASGLTWKFNR